MFILFVLLLIAFIFLCFWNVEMQSHCHWLFVDNTIVFCVHMAPEKVKYVLILTSFWKATLLGERFLWPLVCLNGFCGPMWDVIMLIYSGNPYSFSTVHFFEQCSAIVLIQLSLLLSLSPFPPFPFFSAFPTCPLSRYIWGSTDVCTSKILLWALGSIPAVVKTLYFIANSTKRMGSAWMTHFISLCL